MALLTWLGLDEKLTPMHQLLQLDVGDGLHPPWSGKHVGLSRRSPRESQAFKHCVISVLCVMFTWSISSEGETVRSVNAHRPPGPTLAGHAHVLPKH